MEYIKKHPFVYIILALVFGIIVGAIYGERTTQAKIEEQVKDCLSNDKMEQPTMIECVYNALILPESFE